MTVVHYEAAIDITGIEGQLWVAPARTSNSSPESGQWYSATRKRPVSNAYSRSWAGAYYRQQRAKGSSYQAAVRALAFKWIRILYRCWQTRTRYDESMYLNTLRTRGSPLLSSLGHGSPSFDGQSRS